MRYIAILRGINVGGKRKILMADLRQLMADLGYKDITTYIQSGNIVFEDPASHLAPDVAQTIKKAIDQKYGYDVPVIVITATELAKAIESNPYYMANPDDIDKLHLTFLSAVPDPQKLSKITSLDFAPDQFTVIGKNAFLRCELKYHKTKLSNQFFEKKLGVQATTRNWKTVLKLAELGPSD